MAKHDLLFFENKSTGLVVGRGKSASDNSHYNPDTYGKQTKRKQATPEQEKMIAEGKWVPGDENGRSSDDPKYKKSKIRPHLSHQERGAEFVKDILERKDD